MAKPKTTARPPLVLIDFAKKRREAQKEENIDMLLDLFRRAVAGRVTGLACCFRDECGVERCVFTGPYKANVAEAMNAAARMTDLCLQMQGDLV